LRVTLNGSFVAARVAADDIYPKRSPQGERIGGKGNQESSTFIP
jgi:hypothetical protein